MRNVTECLAANMKRLREEHGLTQSELAAKAKISVVFLQGIETKKKWLSPTTISSIAKALQVSESKLFENCFDSKNEKKPQRLRVSKFDHIPDDIFNALATTCKKNTWRWESVRWIIEGFERTQR